jgi:hypothetical protein
MEAEGKEAHAASMPKGVARKVRAELLSFLPLCVAAHPPNTNVQANENRAAGLAQAEVEALKVCLYVRTKEAACDQELIFLFTAGAAEFDGESPVCCPGAATHEG